MLLLEVPHQNQKSAEKSLILVQQGLQHTLVAKYKKTWMDKGQSYAIEQMFRSQKKESMKKRKNYMKNIRESLKYTYNFFLSYIAAEKIIFPP